MTAGSKPGAVGNQLLEYCDESDRLESGHHAKPRRTATHERPARGVFAAVSVATACTFEGSPAAELAVLPEDGRFAIEHPTGAAEVLIETDATGKVVRAGTLRTARKLMDGRGFPRRRG
ncbi:MULTISPECIES: PrpF domain-containing protein [Thioclava]|jgi:Uncharacterized protein conserved in bacteria|uniref:PrpF domain-containing protein n=1 Tax=Thioclava TaxID=285107 RepID=UPI000C3B32C5|nr:hypothetical protein [Thioclava sp.]